MPAATLSHELVAARAPGELSGALAGFVREAADVYEARGRLRVD